RFVAEEVENAAGRVQEIEGVLRGGRVEDEHLPTPAGVEFVELLGRDVFLRAGEAGRERLVEAVAKDGVPVLGGDRAGDELVPRSLQVEHHRPQLAGSVGQLHSSGLVAELGQAQRVGEATRRVDRQHDGALARERGLQGDGGRHRGLAYTAGAHADDHLALEESGRKGAHDAASILSASASISARPKARSGWSIGRVTRGRESEDRRRSSKWRDRLARISCSRAAREAAASFSEAMPTSSRFNSSSEKRSGTWRLSRTRPK